jgi:hypothetical protein
MPINNPTHFATLTEIRPGELVQVADAHPREGGDQDE